MTAAQFELALPANADVTLHVHVDPTLKLPSLKVVPPAVVSTTVTWAPAVEAIFKRFERNGKTKKWSHRDVAAKLAALGFQPEPPATGHKPYVRWTVHGKARNVTVYQEGSGLVVDSAPLLEFVMTIHGATPPKGKHPKVKWNYAMSVADALSAAGELRAHADTA